mmetsp:Transcript_4947/g.10926  ORF Transcript_4947/g.10926 Transcript_4947/m.10926 type:complete len:95 (+) Transcript_4947:1108-1392(+)
MKTAVQAEPNKVFGRAEFVRRLWHRLRGPRDGTSVGKEECLQGQRKKKHHVRASMNDEASEFFSVSFVLTCLVCFEVCVFVCFLEAEDDRFLCL